MWLLFSCSQMIKGNREKGKLNNGLNGIRMVYVHNPLGTRKRGNIATLPVKCSISNRSWMLKAIFRDLRHPFRCLIAQIPAVQMASISLYPKRNCYLLEITRSRNLSASLLSFQPIPNLSTNIPKHEDQGMFDKGMITWPPTDKLLK